MTQAASPSTATNAAAARLITLQCPSCQSWNRIDLARAADRPACGKCKTPMPLDQPWELTDERFDRTVAESHVPVFVDFYATWCGPCKMMEPFVKAVAKSYLGRALIAKVDVDQAQSVASRYNISAMPTSVLFKDGKEVARQMGAIPQPAIEALLKRAM